MAGLLSSSSSKINSDVLGMEWNGEGFKPESEKMTSESTATIATVFEKAPRRVQENSTNQASPSQLSREGGTSRVYTCDVCDKTLGSRSRLKQHLRLHITERSSQFVCSDGVCSNRGDPANHADTAQIQSIQTSLCIRDTPVNVCDGASSKLTVDETKLTGTKLNPYDMCEVSFLEGSDITKPSQQSVDNHSCDTCPLKFPTSSQLINHKRTSSCDQRFVCSTCSARFTTSSRLANHKRSRNCERRFGCDVCDSRFNTRSHLTIHIRSHTGERPYVCSECDARFCVNSHLTAHKRTHTGEKPYGCGECGARFNKRSHLTIHNRSHTGEKPYGCAECSARFSTNSHLTAHKRTHTGDKPYSCDLCGARFNKSSHVTTHKRSHTGERPYGCDVCNARFSQSSGLSTHRKTHVNKTMAS